MNHSLESRLLGEISATSDDTDDADDTISMAKIEEEIKSLLIRVKEENEKKKS